ncbi:MAG TPA: AEC family transporter [Syntrophomonadaceae bacterium]|nr:AEC family transporter [Syntrophomonadaceae bacterium]
MLAILSILAPIFLVLFGGVLLRRRNLLKETYINTTNHLIYYLFLPALLFSKIAQSDFRTVFSLPPVLIMGGAILAVFLFSLALSRVLRFSLAVQGTFTNDNFRSNFMYIGLPVCFYALGERGLAAGSVLTAFAVPLVNILSVLAFAASNKEFNLGRLMRETFQNPLVIAALLGILCSILQITLPDFLHQTMALLGQATLPLALLCIGASLKLKSLNNNLIILAGSALIKLLLLPYCAYLMFRFLNLPLDVPAFSLMIMLAAPSAEINYILAEEMNGDPELANATIVLTTLLCPLTYLIWLSLLGIH